MTGMATARIFLAFLLGSALMGCSMMTEDQHTMDRTQRVQSAGMGGK